MRAGPVERAELWPWSSPSRRGRALSLDPGPAPRGRDRAGPLKVPMIEAEVAIHESIRRDRPLGTGSSVRATADVLGPEASLRPPGRP